MASIAANLEQVRERIAAAAARAGRDPATVGLVAVSKTVDPERINEALSAGVCVLGENKVQEARVKVPLVSSRARWHMVGHLQSNKTRDAVALFELIHSVDTMKLAADLDKWAERQGKTQPILLEVNVAGDASKFGFKPDDVDEVIHGLGALPRLELRGLMTVPPLTEDPQQARPHFRRLRELRDQLVRDLGVGLPELSMGMSHDFEVAVEEGATLVRVGTAIFGERTKRLRRDDEALGEV